MGVASRHVQFSHPASQHFPQPERLRIRNAEDPATHNQFTYDTPDFSALPDAPGPQCAGFLSCSAREGGWPRATHEVRGNSVGLGWAVPTPVANAGKVSGQGLRRIARRGRPLYSTPWLLNFMNFGSSLALDGRRYSALAPSLSPGDTFANALTGSCRAAWG